MASLTIENYVKSIFQIASRQDNRPVATGQVAEMLSVSPGTVTSMLKTLSDAGLALYTPYEGVRLTDAGRLLALRVLRRHRLIELFLVKTLALTWDEVHDEAENMEHAVSDLLIDRIDAFLGFPPTDPHGDPIPRADGTVTAPAGVTLAECGERTEFRLVRVVDQNADFLRFLRQQGLGLDTAGTVLTNHPAAGTITIEIAGSHTVLARGDAEKLLVTVGRK